MKSIKVLCLGLVLASSSTSALGQDVEGRWGVGGFVAYSSPLFTFGDRWDGNANKWGLNLNYVASNRVTMELEYHRSEFTDGLLVSAPFTWGVTGKEYRAGEVRDDARYDIRFNSLLLSGIVHFRQDRSMDEGSYSPYMVVGAGFYDHSAVAENIVWPGQNEGDALAAGAGKDADGDTLPAVVMARQEDTRTALTGTIGFGLEAFLTPTIAIDVRGRYHFSLSELRPYDVWLQNKVFPLQQYDVAGGFKFYFWE